MKILYVTTVSGTINAFLIPHIQMLLNQGHHVDIACNVQREIDSSLLNNGCEVFDIKFQRSPFHKKNLIAYRKLKNIVSHEKYDLVHTHTPVASVCVRLACRKSTDIAVLYTAHGFHFFKGAAIKNWMLYYPVEWILAHWTDGILTMNSEDFCNAKKMKLKNPNSVFKVNGVGVDLSKFFPKTVERRKELRMEHGLNDHDFVMVYVGELSHRKNQKQVIKSINLLKDKIPNMKMLIVGNGPLEQEYKSLVNQLNLQNTINFLGYRKDIPDIMGLADLGLSSSRQEGLPVNVMEAMATGLPLVVTNTRGNRDLIINNENGYLVELDDITQLANAIEQLYTSEKLRKEFGHKSLDLVKKYSLINVLQEMETVYSKYIHSSQ